jgi:DNA polymerase I-like protein with 3'-5' exonuclease and polymerase domains
MMKKKNMKSVICNTVHDSIILDVHPEEKIQCIDCLRNAMMSIKDECKSRYNVDYDMPVDIELKIGDNWLETNEI